MLRIPSFLKEHCNIHDLESTMLYSCLIKLLQFTTKFNISLKTFIQNRTSTAGILPDEQRPRPAQLLGSVLETANWQWDFFGA